MHPSANELNFDPRPRSNAAIGRARAAFPRFSSLSLFLGWFKDCARNGSSRRETPVEKRKAKSPAAARSQTIFPGLSRLDDREKEPFLDQTGTGARTGNTRGKK